MADRVYEEVDIVRDVFKSNTALIGFYSYGELSPLSSFGNCALHNQTITITTVNEIE
ncbi:hypothetical protein D9M71_772430 [compost metagenome]